MTVLRGNSDDVHFTVWWCPTCGSTQPDNGGDRYCTHCKTDLGGGRYRRGDMERVEVATRDYWARPDGGSS